MNIKISPDISDKLTEIYSRFEPGFIQRTLRIPASVYARLRQGTVKPSQKTVRALIRTARNADRRERYSAAKRAGFTPAESRKIRSLSRSKAFYEIQAVRSPQNKPLRFKSISESLPPTKVSTSLKPVKTLPATIRKIDRAIKNTPVDDINRKRQYVYDLARKTGLTAAEARDIRGWNVERVQKYLTMREGGAMVMHAKAAAEGPLSFVENQNARYNMVARILSRIHNVPVKYIKRGMSINYSLERNVDDWEEYLKEKHGIVF
jgi:hypothetical protein